MKGSSFRLGCSLATLFVGVLLFPALASATVTVQLSGPGEGTITSSPAGINCSNVGGTAAGPTCAFPFAALTGVTLTAVAGGGAVLGSWSITPPPAVSTCTGVTNPCNFLVPFGFPTPPDQTVTATFLLSQSDPQVEMSDVADADITDTSALLKGTVNPTGDQLSACRFEWVRQADPAGFGSSDAQSAPCDPDPGSVNESVPVSESAGGLEANTAYRVRLLAKKDSTGNIVDEAQPFTTKPGAPDVETLQAQSISASRATLVGGVDPRHSDTEYWFELTGLGGAVKTLPAEPATVTGNAGSTVVTAEALDLDPGTAYSYRLFARLQADHDLSAQGDAVTFDTLSAADSALPERAYELVSPRFTNAATADGFMLSPDGNSAFFRTWIPLPDSENAGLDQRVARRNADGSWTATPYFAGPRVNPDNTALDAGASVLFNRTLTYAASTPTKNIDPGDQNARADVYLRSLDTGEFSWMSRGSTLPDTSVTPADRLDYVTEDGRAVYFGSARQLFPTDVSIGQTLYEWRDGKVRQVAFLPGPGGPVGPTQGSLLGSGYGGELEDAVSSDGSRVVFSVANSSGDPVDLYVNDGDEIVEVATGGVRFWGADSGVNSIYYVKSGSLYVFDMATRQSTMVHPAVAGGAGVVRALDVSEDGKRVYFASTKDVLGGARAASPFALWVADRDTSGSFDITYIGVVDPGGGFNGAGLTYTNSNIFPSVAARQYGADAQGDIFAFRSATELVPGRQTGGASQVYVYVRSSDSLYCLSCPVDGADPSEGLPAGQSYVGSLVVSPDDPTNANASAFAYGIGNSRRNTFFQTAIPSVRMVGENGTVAFQASYPLVPGDGNSTWDVYEWKGGEVGLVSSGTGDGAQMVGEVSEDGETILFTSKADLVPGLPEAAIYRVYAARVGGGLAESEPADAACRGAACRVVGGEPTTPDRGIGARRGRSGPREAAKKSCARPLRRLSKQRRLVKRKAVALRRLKTMETSSHRTKAAGKQLVRAKKGHNRLRRKVRSCRRAAR